MAITSTTYRSLPKSIFCAFESGLPAFQMAPLPLDASSCLPITLKILESLPHASIFIYSNVAAILGCFVVCQTTCCVVELHARNFSSVKRTRKNGTQLLAKIFENLGNWWGNVKVKILIDRNYSDELCNTDKTFIILYMSRKTKKVYLHIISNLCFLLEQSTKKSFQNRFYSKSTLSASVKNYELVVSINSDSDSNSGANVSIYHLE